MGRPPTNPDPVDLLLSLLILRSENMGRYTLSTYLNLTKAKTRSILDYMVTKNLANTSLGRGGTQLTLNGRQLAGEIAKKVELNWDNSIVVIDRTMEFIPADNEFAICLIQSEETDTNGLYERDIAVRSGANGAITLIRDGENWVYNDPNPEFRVQPEAVTLKNAPNPNYSLMVITFGPTIGSAYAGLSRIVGYHCNDLLDLLD